MMIFFHSNNTKPLSFRDRAERRQWYQILHSQTVQRFSSRSGTPFKEPAPANGPKLRVTTVTPASLKRTREESVTSIGSPYMGKGQRSGRPELEQPEVGQKRKSRRRSALELLQSFKVRFESLAEKTIKPRKPGRRSMS